MRLAQGGKFHHGFLSGFVSSLGGSYMDKNRGDMTVIEKIAISAAIGGTAEALGGGKFANGAVTGAYVMTFNHIIHQELIPKSKDMSGKWDWQKLNKNQKAQVIIDNLRQYNINGGGEGDIRISDFFYNIPTGEDISIVLKGAIVDIGGEAIQIWIDGAMKAKLYAPEGQTKSDLWYQKGQDFFRLNYGNSKLFIDTDYKNEDLIWNYINGRTLKNEEPIIKP